MRKKMWKKIIAWILCVCILTQSFPLNAASVSRIARGTELWTGCSQVNLNGTGETVFLSESTSDKGVVYSVDESGKLIQEETKKEKDSSDKKKGDSTDDSAAETEGSGNDNGKDDDSGKGDAVIGSTGTETGSAGSSESDADKTAADKTDEGKTDADKNDADKTGADKTNADKTGADKTDADKTDADKNDADKTDAGKTDVDKTDADKDTSDAGDAADDNGIGGEGSLNSGTVHKNSAANALKDQDGTDGTSESGQDGQDHAAPELYDNGAIRIYNLEQLRAIGTDTALTDEDDESDTFGSGEAVTVDGTPVTYSLDGQYVLMNDITLDSDALWQLPEGFAGTFASDADSETTTVDENAPLYDKATDTIYIYNNYQLMTMALDTAAEEPVMSRDMIAEDFGMGQLVYPDGAPTENGGSAAETAQDYLTYSPEHNYVLVQEFTGEMPEMKAEALADDGADHKYGRKYEGQVIWKDDSGKEYILIGNKQQLEAIGKKDGNDYIEVTGAAYTRPLLGPDLEYCGDADLDWSDKNNGGKLLDGAHKAIWYGGKEENGKPDLGTIGKHATGKKYSPDENYIIFRDIDLGEDEQWTPLNLTGNIEGRKNMVDGQEITISNVNITQSGEIDPSVTNGVGFFGSITAQRGDDLGQSAGNTWVKNIHLDKVTVKNTSTTVKEDVGSLVEGILGLLGGVVGGLLDHVTGIVGGLLGWIIPGLGHLELGDVVKDLLEVRKNSVDIYATGSFAGRIVGDVKIENCKVTDTSVTGSRGMTGGFVGYTSGEAKYALGLGGYALDALSGLLNIIPGLGLGDLITVVKDVLGADELLPIGYYRPTFKNCEVTLKNGAGTIGTIETDASENNNYNGGFVGMQIGTVMNNCKVHNLSSVSANMGAGGFAGIERDGIIGGLLKDQVGVDLALKQLGKLTNFNVKSEQKLCGVNGTGSGIKVTANDQYAGGFNGVMTNSISKQCTVDSLTNISAKNGYAGGFAGRATMGYGVTLASEEEKKDTLLGEVTGLVSNLVTGDEDRLNTLLSLSGLEASELYDCSVSGTGWTVEVSDGDYAGGLIGQGDGVKISSKDGGAGNKITGLSSVKAKNYAGGIAGSVVTASPVGVLNETVGIGSLLPFEVSNLSLTGSNLKVEAKKKCAAGGLGLALGGNVTSVEISGVSSVEAGNYAGGLAGRSGTGGLIKEGGLDLLGLGLVKIDNLLSLAQGTAVTIADTKVGEQDVAMTIHASGDADITDGESILAGGFIAEAEGVQINNSEVLGLKEVTAVSSDKDKETYAAGFVGRSHTGGLANIAEETEDGGLKLPEIANINSLLDVLPYLLPTYTGCSVSFASNGDDPQVQAQYAGGFFGSMESGQVNNSGAAEGEEGAGKSGNRTAAVQGLEYVRGTDYAGGFAGRVDAGAAASSDGLSLLGGTLQLDVDDILSVLNVYIPEITSADVQSSENGLMVEATAKGSSAGGYIGYGSGVQIDDSNVGELRHTKVTPPSDSLESGNENNYFDPAQSSYAVKGGQYAGGYIGCADIGSAAKVGGGLGILGDAITITDITEALDVVCTSIKDSNVTGAVGGYSVLANGTDSDGPIGMAGGYAGKSSGTQITNSDALNFAYIIGQENAGGYAGMLEPGNVASVLEDGDILNSLLSVDSLLSVMQSFIPIIETSQATSIPCGGAVRAQGMTTDGKTRGLAGGYVGYNHGGRIQGSTGKECAVVRLRSVYGGEFAGGFTGLMENGAVADAGNLSLLFGLIKIDNILGLLQAVYPTETDTAVYGPLRNVDVETWNAWAEAVGSNGVYGYQFPADKVNSEEQLSAIIPKYAYGYNVKAGRDSVGGTTYQAGCAGGYVGRMQGGVITRANAWDVKDVIAYKSAGGFAGEMSPDGAAEIGSVGIAGLDILDGLKAVQTFVPAIRNSDVAGYQSGMSVKATGIPYQGDKVEKVGYAGGYVGHMVGGQVWGNWEPVMDEEQVNTNAGISTMSVIDAQRPDADDALCRVQNLRRVDGANAVGGFAGLIEPGSAANLDTASSSGLLDGLLQAVIGSPGNLLSVLEATLSTVRAVNVEAWNPYGIVINGAYSGGSNNTQYAKAAGGFVGEMNGAVIGSREEDQAEGSAANAGGQANTDGAVQDTPVSGVYMHDIREVTGGEYAGGFFGLADVSAVAEISGEGETGILGSLVKLGAVDVLDAFRSYVYHSKVTGTEGSGLEVSAHTATISGIDTARSYTGNAGGFGGTLLNGSVIDSHVERLRKVTGLNYTGGFIGHLGKSGTVDLDKLGLLDDILGIGAGVLDIFGSHVENSSVTGMDAGYTVRSHNDAAEKSGIAGGFAGYADLAKLDDNTVRNLKQVASDEVAGGFAGQTSFAYLANVELDSGLVNILVDLVNQILQGLQVDGLQQGDLIHIDLGIIQVDALYEGDLAHVNLLGLDISVGLADEDQLVRINIGDSKIEINCGEDGEIDETDIKEHANEIQLSLIKANRTRIRGCKVSGIPDGYDVYGGGAGNNQNGLGNKGYAGGFVGLNNEGLLEENQMYLADVVRGTKGIVGPFTGASSLESSWEFNTVYGIEGNGNQYRIYRSGEDIDDFGKYEKILKSDNGTELQSEFKANNNGLSEAGFTEPFPSDAKTWNIYTIRHMQKDKVEKFSDLKDAVMSNDSKTLALNAYMEDGAMAVLMDGTATEDTEPGDEELPPDMQDPCKNTVEITLQKIWTNDKEEERPDDVTFYIYRTYLAEGKDDQVKEKKDEAFGDKAITLTKDDMKTTSPNIWEKVLSGFPYTAYKMGTDGTKYFYTYHISEIEVKGYTTTIEYPKGYFDDDYHYTIKVTNKGRWADISLPGAGGMGTWYLYLFGCALLFLVLATYLRSRTRLAEAVAAGSRFRKRGAHDRPKDL